MEFATLGLFCFLLVLCLVLKIDIIYALLAGLVIFVVYSLIKKYKFTEVLKMMWDGIKTAKVVIILFALVGLLTASWRASGTVAFVVSYAARLIKPEIFYLMTFLLNCAVSMLIGTATGTGGTIGVICVTFGAAIGANMAITGGAIVCGSYFGDRCSPVSTSLLLVTQLTGTDHYKNIKRLLKRMIGPLAITCVIYLIIGLMSQTTESMVDVESVFKAEFNFHWALILPAALVIVLALLKVKALYIMLTSSFTAALMMILIQKQSVLTTLKVLVVGFTAETEQVAKMLNGGGLYSMLSLVLVIVISATYAGIFKATGLLSSTQSALNKLSGKITLFGGMAVTGLLTAMVTCNQTLSIILTEQLNGDSYDDKEELAMALSDSAVVIAPLVPWCIAGQSILTATDTPTLSLAFGIYLYVQVIWTFVMEARKRRKK